jgi:glycine cleavage system H protein
MTELRFTQSHEWISAEDGIATVGITRYAADQLGDVVFVELPAVGKIFAAGAEAGVVESVKAASEIYAPLAGEVTEVNESLGADPAAVNSDPEGKAWFFRVRLANPSSVAALMTKDQYTEFLKGL